MTTRDGSTSRHNKYTHFLIYVKVLNAVQFGDNWLRKMPKRLDEVVGQVQFGTQRNVLEELITANLVCN